MSSVDTPIAIENLERPRHFDDVARYVSPEMTSHHPYPPGTIGMAEYTETQGKFSVETYYVGPCKAIVAQEAKPVDEQTRNSLLVHETKFYHCLDHGFSTIKEKFSDTTPIKYLILTSEDNVVDYNGKLPKETLTKYLEENQEDIDPKNLFVVPIDQFNRDLILKVDSNGKVQITFDTIGNGSRFKNLEIKGPPYKTYPYSWMKEMYEKIQKVVDAYNTFDMPDHAENIKS